MTDILYCFISHQPFIEEDSVKISEMMKKINYNHYIIVYGGERNKNIRSTQVVHLDCPDDYCSLPEKINKTFNYSINNITFNFLVKFDRTVKIKKIFHSYVLDDYCGIVKRFISPKWHFGRCVRGHIWYNKKCVHPKIQYAIGLGYVLSRRNVNFISKDNSYYSHVCEDVYVGSVMIKNNIIVKNFRFNFLDYFYDENHSNIKQ